MPLVFCFIDLVGPATEFYNVKVHQQSVYCTYCKALIGCVARNLMMLVVKHHRLVRFDPHYLINMCRGDTHDISGDMIEHRHISFVATTENAITAPVLPVQLRSMLDGRLLSEPCPFAGNYVQCPPFSIAVQTNSTVEGSRQPVVTRHDDAFTKKDDGESVTDNTVDSSMGNTLPVDSSDASSVPMETVANNSQPKNERVIRVTLLKSGELNFRSQTLDEFVRDQPSTSSGTYERPVIDLVNSHKRFKSDDGAAQSADHNFSGVVSFSHMSYFCNKACLFIIFPLCICLNFHRKQPRCRLILILILRPTIDRKFKMRQTKIFYQLLQLSLVILLILWSRACFQ